MTEHPFNAELAESSTHWVENVQEACDTLRDWLADAESDHPDMLAMASFVRRLGNAAEAEHDRR